MILIIATTLVTKYIATSFSVLKLMEWILIYFSRFRFSFILLCEYCQFIQIISEENNKLRLWKRFFFHLAYKFVMNFLYKYCL